MLNTPKNSGVILAIFLLSILLISPVVAYDIECNDVTTNAKNFANTGYSAVNTGTIGSIHFYDIGARQGFKSVLFIVDLVVKDADAPASAYTALTFKSADLITSYGTGIIGYNYNYAIGKYQIFITSDECGIFAGLDAGTTIALVYDASEIYNLTPNRGATSISNCNINTPDSTTIAMCSASTGYSIGHSITGYAMTLASYDCYNINVGIDVDLDTPNPDFNQFSIYRNGFDVSILLDDNSNKLTPFYAARNMLDEVSLGDAPETDFIYYDITLHGTDKICTGSSFGSTSNPTLTFRAIDSITGSYISGVTYHVYSLNGGIWYNNTVSNSSYMWQTTGIEIGDCITFALTKDGYTDSPEYGYPYCLSITGNATYNGYLDPLSTDENNVNLYFFTYWLDGVTPRNLAGVPISITYLNNTQIAWIQSNIEGVATVSVPKNNTYKWGVTGSDGRLSLMIDGVLRYFTLASGSVTVTTTDARVYVELIPTSLLTQTPTPPSTTVTTIPPLTPSGGGAAGGLVNVWAHYLGVEGWLILAIIALIASIVVGAFAGYVVGLNGGTGGGYAFVMSFEGTFIVCSILWHELLIFDIVMIIVGLAIIIFMGRNSGG